MPSFERPGGITIHYEVHGAGYPVLLLAPGGMRSCIAFWDRAPFHPVRELAGEFQVIAMDQRNAGRSRAPVRVGDGWPDYTADQLALLDHLGIACCHVLGGCIGGAFALALIQAAPERISAAVLQQPIGHSPDNREVFYGLVDDWAKELAPSRPDVTPEAWVALRERMYGGDFVFSVSPAAVRAMRTPLLVLMGQDIYHPSAVSREIAALSPRAELLERWKDPELVQQTVARVRNFLGRNSPAPGRGDLP